MTSKDELARAEEEARKRLGLDSNISPVDPVPLSDTLKHIHLPDLLPATRTTAQREAEAVASELRKRDEAWEQLAVKIGVRYARMELSRFKFYGEAECQARQRGVVGQVRDYMHQLPERVQAGSGLVLFGPPGTGKDMLAAVAMRAAVLNFGFSVDWVNGADLFGALRDAISTETAESKTLGKWIRPKILVLSDPVPPWGSLTEFQAVSLFRVIDARYRNNLPTWVTLNVADGADAAMRMGPQVVSRLRQGAMSCVCDWPDYRSMIHQ